MARRVHSGPFVGKRTFGLSRRATDQWCINNARIRMIGSGIPINQSRAPLPKPMTASMILTDRITQSVFEGSLQREPMSTFSNSRTGTRFSWPLFVRSAVPSFFNQNTLTSLCMMGS